jgi:hypothetical protein
LTETPEPDLIHATGCKDPSLRLFFDVHCHSVCNKNEYQESSWTVKGDQVVRLTTSLPSVRQMSKKKRWEPRRLTALWTSTAIYRDSFTFIFLPVFQQCDKIALAEANIQEVYI